MNKILTLFFLTAATCLHANQAFDPARHLAVVNQVGYEPGWPMRFTAPLSPDGTKFEIRRKNETTPQFQGTIEKGIGDFSRFQPAAGAGEFVIVLHGGTLADAPGHSIVPNLLMYEVAKREHRPDADRYLQAAVAQAGWIIKNLDWNDPRTTKGQRMSEQRTIPNLVWLLQHYPDQAPAGLRAKIEEWSKVVVARSDNFWDFRRYDLDHNWTIPKLNETGNLAGFPACTLSASWVVQNPATKQRLREIAIAHIDNLFGRNPRLAAAPFHPEMGFPDIKRGWPAGHPDNACARLELCRGSLSSSPGTEMYPLNPGGEYRHREGWVNYGAAWCVSLSYLVFDRAAEAP